MAHSAYAITCSLKSRLQCRLQTSKMLYVQYDRIYYFFTQIGLKRINHSTLQEIEITFLGANHQDAVCLSSHSAIQLLNRTKADLPPYNTSENRDYLFNCQLSKSCIFYIAQSVTQSPNRA